MSAAEARRALGERLGHTFTDDALFDQALAHRSWCAEHPGHQSNERLEFLGDAVLGWVVADLAFRHHRGLDEGKLTDIRKAVVNAGALAQVAEELGVGPSLSLGKGEAAAGGREKRSILSDAIEALIGAVYLDGGPQDAYDLVERLLGPRIVGAAALLDGLDHKTALQELAARVYGAAPRYLVEEEGPDHAKRFFATVSIDRVVWGSGAGRSKKQAEQAAARDAHAHIAAQLADEGA